ncbi:conserved protein of unknown function [Rhodovastum atsumiense]|uniref:Uncharacterized protein n=1 Tax=Rhodovastum atsumiense TaxID=504468 RepID=A0A5M6IQS4_9PROT|nr:DUF6502 family protein [Rhodovastum atsumiense]KAA5610239.1 hypothetical protein F1189_20515 [Rhodovastum atsumiense]CAH2604139.1 conserved protein of unknown function [Rhodovastum atsumiense]
MVSDRTASRDVLLKAVLRLLRPLVRLLARNGVTYPVFAELLRGLYVDVVARDLLRDPRDRTDSRISLLSGVHRKEIRRWREAGAASLDVPEDVTLSSQIIARWLGAEPWRDPDGTPRALPRLASAGSPSFEELVASCTRDLRPRAVLDAWMEQGLVSVDAQDRVVLDIRAFVPSPGRDEQMFYFARNLHDHIAAASANVTGSGVARFLDRSVHYDRLPVEAAARLEALGRESAQAMLLAVNRAAIEIADRADATATPGGATQRVNLGVYLYVEDESPETRT